MNAKPARGTEARNLPCHRAERRSRRARPSAHDGRCPLVLVTKPCPAAVINLAAMDVASRFDDVRLRPARRPPQPVVASVRDPPRPSRGGAAPRMYYLDGENRAREHDREHESRKTTLARLPRDVGGGDRHRPERLRAVDVEEGGSRKQEPSPTSATSWVRPRRRDVPDLVIEIISRKPFGLPSTRLPSPRRARALDLCRRADPLVVRVNGGRPLGQCAQGSRAALASDIVWLTSSSRPRPQEQGRGALSHAVRKKSRR